MKFVLLAAFSLSGLVGCSHMHDTKRIPASVKDVGVIGPSGEVILYYKEGNYIVVKACEPNTVLGMTPAQARANCQGRMNKVPVESFRQALRNLVSTDSLNILKPLTREEIRAYSAGSSSSTQVEAMTVELERINAFIQAYGRENANLVRREELVEALRSQATLRSAIAKINREIERAIDLISDQTRLTLSRFSSDGDQFLYTVLKQFNPNQKFPCGLSGSVDERIADCSAKEDAIKEGFVLVTRSRDFKEVHKDVETGLLWSDKLPNRMNHYSAQSACQASLLEVAGITGKTWRLPTIEEYQAANSNGIRAALPNMNYWFWSSSVHRNYASLAWLWSGFSGDTYIDYYRSSYDSVRCVAR